MILKIRRPIEGETALSGAWEFIDNIGSVTAGIDGEDGHKFISYERSGEILTQDVTDGCYLLNDFGKTIERIA